MYYSDTMLSSDISMYILIDTIIGVLLLVVLAGGGAGCTACGGVLLTLMPYGTRYVLFPIPYTEATLTMSLIHNEKDISPRLRSGLS